MSKHVFAAAVLSLLTAGCAVSNRGGVSRLTVRQGLSFGTGNTRVPPAPRAWEAGRPLSWPEFGGVAPTAGVEGARTVYLLRYESRCHGADFTFDVTAVFLPDQSWVKPEVLADPNERTRVLQHEQTHFNLTEVFARRMRKYFAELYSACRQTDEALGAMIDRFVNDEAAYQQRYDEETRYGLTGPRQRQWDTYVTEMLTSLEGFAREHRPTPDEGAMSGRIRN